MRISSLLLVALSLLTASIPVPAVTKCPPGIHPIVFASYEGDIPCANLLGGAVDGKWVQPEDLWTKVKGGEQYQLYSPFARLGVATGEKAVSTDEDPTTEPPSVKLNRPKAVQQCKETVIGVCGTWNVLPRVPRAQDTKQAVYQQVVREQLHRHGLKTAKVNIIRLWRIDLEGDGQEEVVIEATSPNFDFEPKPYSYSLVLVRKIVNGKVKTIPVDEFYWKKGQTFMDAVNVYALQSILDVNGDGVMEILTSWAYYEGNGNSVYAIKSGKAEQVLCAGWGV